MPRPTADAILLADYDPSWPRMFEEERRRLEGAIGRWAVAIEHVGSTAVPGLASKPIIDMGIALRSPADALKCITPLVELGYECLGEYGIAGRIYFRKRTREPLPGQVHAGVGRTHQIHMYETGHGEWDAHITFRDYLRADAGARRDYEALKRGLAALHAGDVEAYANAKCDFVRGVLRKAGYDLARKQWSDEPSGATA
ncbi:MAG: GrpB family protein [Dehalococcoidia bacterium]|nr:GrpB family protein [Dehalococcoidia bacterium]